MSERDVFMAALQIEDLAERCAYLDKACGADTGLRQRVEVLLKAFSRAGSFLQQPAADGTTSDAPRPGPYPDMPHAERPGTVIGPYKLMEQIGEGGMGLVYVAEQQEPIRRKVALKIIKPGMDTRQVIARFEAERQALALMDHPNIARVLDGGTTESSRSRETSEAGGTLTSSVMGRPYFVMELVKGTPITEYCDQNQVPVRERLELFVDVCQAVQHAHQKGIIHRDIKPSNVLVTSHDGKPVVKVIDFGVAKAIGQQLTDKTVYTQFAQLIGTPLYMSPEQAGESSLDIDTRSDIYSLGVLLYELLTGTTPFDEERLSQVGYDEMRRIIREEEPPKPSTRISTLGQAANTASANRKSDSKRLCQLLRGELDWIVMNALEKDRNRRYETPSAFAADVQRYLADEPVLACPPSAWYRFRKFARRNKRGLAVAVLVLFFIVLLGFGAGWYQQEQAARALARAERQRETERAVTAAVAQAKTLLDEGDKQADDPVRWQATVDRAELAVQRAEEVLATGEATEEMTGRVRRVRDAVAAARTDIRLLADLDRIQFAWEEQGGFNLKSSYAEALRAYGVNLATPEEAAARVRGSRLRESLLAALEQWRLSTEGDVEGRWVNLRFWVRSAPDAFQKRWLAALPDAYQKRPGDIAALIRMTDEPEVRDRGLRKLLLSVLEDWRRLWETVTGIERLQKLLQEAEPAAHNFQARWQAALKDVPWNGLSRTMASSRGREGLVADLERMIGEPEVKALPPVAVAKLARDLMRVSDLPGGRAAAERLLRQGLERYPGDFWLNYEMVVVLGPLVGQPVRKMELARQGRHMEAVFYARVALTARTSEPIAHLLLGRALDAAGDLEKAILSYQAVLRLRPNNDRDPGYLCIRTRGYLCAALLAKGDKDGARRECQTLLEISRRNRVDGGCDTVGSYFEQMGDLGSAIRAYQAALQINPEADGPRFRLAMALCKNGDLEGASREIKVVSQKDPRSAGLLHAYLGQYLYLKGDLDGAMREYQAGAQLNPGLQVETCQTLYVILSDKGDREGASRVLQVVTRLNPERAAQAHMMLGAHLETKGDVEGAIREYQAGIRIDPKHYGCYRDLGPALQRQGRLAEALRVFENCYDVVPESNANLRRLVADRVLQAERLVELDAKLPKVLKGQVAPAHPGEGVRVGWLCHRPCKQLNAAAARFYAEAFAAEPKLAEDLGAQYRYNAACAAALAGCGQGKDTGQSDDKERVRLRRQALEWLRADLAVWANRMHSGKADDRAAGQQALRHWQLNPDFVGVRGATLAKLPEAERRPWQKLWADVNALLTGAVGKSPGQEK
jgi:serine/threonine protein kinase/tetratricopeptide (TPR) repeat protein